MFENAKLYNEDESLIYKDAVDLQVSYTVYFGPSADAMQMEARMLAEQEKRKPDSEFVMEDGRLPLPEGILHNGTLWKVGTTPCFLVVK